MTRIPPIVFALLLGLVLGWFLLFFIYIDGPLDQRLVASGLFAVLITAYGWFQARRVITKNTKEQRKQRLIAILLMFVAAGALTFTDYKTQQGRFIANCMRSSNLQTCRCIERKVLPAIWFEHVKLRPQMALHSVPSERVWEIVFRANAARVSQAATSCAIP